jgi:hypothetical protein
VFTSFLELNAPDDEVLRAFPECDMAPDGRPTRRTRIRTLLARQSMMEEEFEEFVDKDVENVIDLFRAFNDGTHGTAGKYSFGQLKAMKTRVEEGILFLANLVA